MNALKIPDIHDFANLRRQPDPCRRAKVIGPFSKSRPKMLRRAPPLPTSDSSRCREGIMPRHECLGISETGLARATPTDPAEPIGSTLKHFGASPRCQVSDIVV